MTLPTHRTVEAVAAYLGVRYMTVLKLISTGELRAVKAGRRWIITDEAVTDYVNGVTAAAPARRPSGRAPRAASGRATRSRSAAA